MNDNNDIWAHAPNWANYLAMDGKGEWYYFEHKPEKVLCGDIWLPKTGRYGAVIEYIDWETSLQERPKT